MKLENVFEVIEDYTTESITALEKIVKIPTIAAENSGKECADVVLNLLKKEINFETQKIMTAAYPIIYAEKNVGAKTTLIFYDHYDVQPADPLEKWISPPFKPEIREGKLYGRGVSDNKGNIIARIFAIKAYQTIFGELPLNIKFVIEGEEEIGSPHLENFTEQYSKLLQGDFCIWESGHRNSNRQQQVWLGVKGIVYLDLEVSTAKRDIHSSWGGVVENPAWDLIWALDSLKDKEQTILIEGFYDDIQPPTEAELKQLETIPFDETTYYEDFGITNFMKSGFELKRAYYYSPTLTIDGLNSGYQGPGSKTIIPSKAKAKIDLRLVPNQKPNDILMKIKRHLQKKEFKNVKITSYNGYPPARTSINSKYLKIICDTGEKLYRKPLVVHPTTAGSGPMYLFAHKMDCLSLGCGHANNLIHAPNENILIEDLLLNMKHFAAIFHSFSHKS